MRILLLASWERNIRRIGSLQSSISDPVGEAVGDVGDGILRLESDEQEALDRGDSSKHHRLGVFWMALPTMLSPSSFPVTSNRSVRGEDEKRDVRMVRTFENNGFLRDPYVSKSPFLFSGFKKHPTRQARIISKNTDPVVVKGLDRVGSELTLVFLC
jgi:hypothetical protein